MIQFISPSIVKALKVEAIVPSSKRQTATFFDFAPIITNGTHITVESTQRILRTSVYLGTLKHFWSDWEFRCVMPCLRVEERRTSNPNACILKNTTTDADITLGFGHISGLNV